VKIYVRYAGKEKLLEDASNAREGPVNIILLITCAQYAEPLYVLYVESISQ